jgi:hypothetical protein
MSLSTQAPPISMTPIDTLAIVDPCNLHIPVVYDPPHTAPLPPNSDDRISPPSTSSSEFSHFSLEPSLSLPPRRRPVSRRQSSISYRPADSPRLWAPRTPTLDSNSLKRSVSLSSASDRKDARAAASPIYQRPVHEPAVLTLAEKCGSVSFLTVTLS